MNTLILTATVLGLVGATVTDPFAPITTGLTDMVPQMLTALGIVIGAVLGIIALTWGFPRIVGFFRKNAK
jgi:fructose-specific phosphotransferase system IIC component